MNNSLKKVVFDVDDVLWSLNRRVASIANVDYDKIITYSITDNPILSSDEKKRILDVYFDDSIFEDIEWYPAIKFLNTINADVYINSNALTERAAELKRTQLLRVLNIPADNIRINIISDPKHKQIDDDTYIFVDDSPYNIINSSAKFNIMLNCPWNISPEGLQVLAERNKSVIKCDSLDGIIDVINHIINNT